MSDVRYQVGDRVLASRSESGEDHEEATVVDSYALLMGDEQRPMVVVEFADGERKWMAAQEPNVLPAHPEEAAEESSGEPDG